VKSFRRAVALLVLASSGAVAAPDPWAGGGRSATPASPDLKGPALETRSVTVTVPPVPTFELPAMPPGQHGVRELHVAGKPLLDTEVQVTGYVTWIYDCEVEVRKLRETVAQVRRRIDADPTLCQRAKFYLGDTRDTPPERSLWVVDVPRPFNKLERERIAKADRTVDNYPDRCEPDPKRPRAPYCMPLAVGDYVTLTGTFSVQSPHSERNSDGLIVFRSLAFNTPPKTPPPMRAVTMPTAKGLPPLRTTPVRRPAKDVAASNASIRISNEGMKAYGQKQFPIALTKFREAVAAWDGNHQAWYGMAGAQIGLQDWSGATSAAANAFEIMPDQAMYAMVYGYSLYNDAISKAREAQARRENRRPEEIQPDLTGVDFSRAEQLLRHAVTLEDSLWRAHYYLGRIARDTGHAKDAATSLSKAVSYGPYIPEPWIALGELYRKWQFTDQARQTFEQAVTYVPEKDASDLWYALGMAHDDVHQDAKAMSAFSKALAIKPDHYKAMFQRGQTAFRLGKRADAKRDLTAFLAAKGSSLEFAKQQAQKMLLDLAATK
jgi:tetratricopeptide (TPR) repeat protein